MHLTALLLASFALFSTTWACLIASFQYFPPPPDSALAKPHLIGNLTSSNHPNYPDPICWLSKIKLEAPNNMYPLYCKEAGVQAYVWFTELAPMKDGRGRDEVFGKTQNVAFISGGGPLGTNGAEEPGQKLNFRLEKDPGNENHVGAWNYDCRAEHALW